MIHPLLAHFLERAEGLADVATVVDDGDGVHTLRPFRDGALGLWIGVPDDTDDEVVWGYDADWSVVEDFFTTREMDCVLDAVVEGRVRVLRGRGRDEVQWIVGEGFERQVIVADPWLRPGWRRRAQVVDHPPYRE